eukprot:3940674-Rhodomonas_salina.2
MLLQRSKFEEVLAIYPEELQVSITLPASEAMSGTGLAQSLCWSSACCYQPTRVLQNFRC